MSEEIKWKEPREFLQEADRQARARMPTDRRWAFAAGTVMLFLALVVWNRGIDTVSVELTVVHVAFSAFWAWCIYWARPWIRERRSSTIHFGLGISRRRALMGILAFSYRDFQSHYWLPGDHYETLILLARKRLFRLHGSFYAIGVPDQATREKASALLIKKGISEMPEGTAHLQTPRFRNLIEAHGINLIILPTSAFIIAFGKIFGG